MVENMDMGASKTPEQKRTKAELEKELEEIKTEIKKCEEKLEKMKDFDAQQIMKENPSAFYGKTELEIATDYAKEVEDVEKEIERLQKMEDEIMREIA